MDDLVLENLFFDHILFSYFLWEFQQIFCASSKIVCQPRCQVDHEYPTLVVIARIIHNGGQSEFCF